jgi:hypothetical protein
VSFSWSGHHKPGVVIRGYADAIRGVNDTGFYHVFSSVIPSLTRETGRGLVFVVTTEQTAGFASVPINNPSFSPIAAVHAALIDSYGPAAVIQGLGQEDHPYSQLVGVLGLATDIQMLHELGQSAARWTRAVRVKVVRAIPAVEERH